MQLFFIIHNMNTMKYLLLLSIFLASNGQRFLGEQVKPTVPVETDETTTQSSESVNTLSGTNNTQCDPNDSTSCPESLRCIKVGSEYKCRQVLILSSAKEGKEKVQTEATQEEADLPKMEN